jgi:hypothetical protein
MYALNKTDFINTNNYGFLIFSFVFVGCILLLLLLINLGVPTIPTVFFQNIFIIISYPLLGMKYLKEQKNVF